MWRPSEGFSLVVDGHFKTHYDDQEAAQKAGAELFGRFPMLQIMIYDAATKDAVPASDLRRATGGALNIRVAITASRQP